MKLCIICSEPSEGSRCANHPPRRLKESSTRRGYNSAWDRLSKRARKLQPWCSDCGSKEDLTADHLRWPARTLNDVDVTCRPCNTKRGATPRDGQHHNRGVYPSLGGVRPQGEPFLLTQFENDSHLGGVLGG